MIKAALEKGAELVSQKDGWENDAQKSHKAEGK